MPRHKDIVARTRTRTLVARTRTRTRTLVARSAKDKGKDFSCKDKDKDKDFKLVLKDNQGQGHIPDIHIAIIRQLVAPVYYSSTTNWTLFSQQKLFKINF